MPGINDVLERELTPQQRGAAVDQSSEVLALACAGSGKSKTLSFRIARLVAEGEDSPGIVAFTFTEKAAESIKRGISTALRKADIDSTVLGAMYVGTIHSYCQHVLGQMDARYRQFDVLDENRLKLYLISRYLRLGLNAFQNSRGVRYFEVVREISSAWKLMNDEMLRIEDVEAADPELGRILRGLGEQLDRDEFIDFSLMIRLVADALEQNSPGANRAVAELRHLMVDEYQDVNPAQERLIQQLHARSQTLFVVGDDDQAIYAWRGADVSNILTFRERFPSCGVHTLPKNFRSTPAIVISADRMAAAELGPSRITKNPEADNPSGPRDLRNLWFANRDDEANWVANRIQALLGTAYIERDGTVRGLTPSDFAILMRSTRTAEQDGHPRHHAFSQALNTRHISYSLESGGGVFDRPQVAILRDAFELLRGGAPTREIAQEFFTNRVRAAFAHADFGRFASVLTEWARKIHAPITGTRRRVYPQQLVHELLEAFGIQQSNFETSILQDIGIFSRIMQDVEAVYLSVDNVYRFSEILNFLQNVADTGYDTSTDDVLRRPDAVTIATVHKMKGLEFPVVFVVDVEANRFPGTRRQYSGWLPQPVIAPAIGRGAYHSTRNEEARLFYTAITRAERFLYVSGCARLPGGQRQFRPSPFALLLAHPELSTDPLGLPDGVQPHAPAPRVDETVLPTAYSDIKYFLTCPRDYQFRKSFGFSPPIPDLFGFGKTVHTAVGKLHEQFSSQAPTPDQAEALAREVFHLKHVPPSRDPQNSPGAYERAKESAVSIVRHYAEDYADDFTQNRQVEQRFEIPLEQSVIAGAIDLLLKRDSRGQVLEAQVVDFKAMAGGDDPTQDDRLSWPDLALQVQLYARAARCVLGENARTGSVHLLKDNQRVEVPVTDDAVSAAVENVEWAVDRIIDGDFPRRPARRKCELCDFRMLCQKSAQTFKVTDVPPPIHTPGVNGTEQKMARAFSDFES